MSYYARSKLHPSITSLCACPPISPFAPSTISWKKQYVLLIKIFLLFYIHLSPGPEQGKSLHGSNSLESPWHDLPPYLASSRTFLDLCLMPPTHDLEQGLQIVHSSHLQSTGEQFTMRPSVAGTKVFCPSTWYLYFQTWSASVGQVSACSVCAIFQHCTFFLRLLMVYARFKDLQNYS